MSLAASTRPPNPALRLVTVYTQGGTFAPGAIQLTNAIDFTIGEVP